MTSKETIKKALLEYLERRLRKSHIRTSTGLGNIAHIEH